MSTRLLPAIFCDHLDCRRWTAGEADTTHVLRTVSARWGWSRRPQNIATKEHR